MGMNQEFARMYSTPGYAEAAVSEDSEKTAQVQLFAKLAQSQNIDFSGMTDEQIQQLWDYTFQKAAEDGSPPPFPPKKEGEEKKDEKKEEEKKEEEKKAAIARDHATKMASIAEEQRAERLGQKMAHAYVAELNEIYKAQDKTASAQQPAAATPAVTAPVAEVKEAARNAPPMPPAVSKAMDKVREGGKSKKASAVDAAALEYAVKLAADAQLDLDEASDRLLAVMTLGGPQSQKLASTPDGWVEVRALEFLEAAGYPVEWTQ